MSRSTVMTDRQPDAPDIAPAGRGFPRAWWTAVRRWPGAALARGGVVSIVDQAVVSGTNFLTAVIIGRLGSQEGLGVYYLALTIVLIARGVQEQVIAAPYQVYSHGRRGRDLAEYAGSSIAHQLMLAVLTVVALAALVGVMTFTSSPAGLLPVVGVLMLAAPMLLLRDFVRHFCFAHLRPGRALATDGIVAVLQLGGLAVLAWIGALSVPAAYVVMGVACAVAAGAWLATRRESLRPRRARLWTDWTTNWRFGRWALAGYLIGSTSPYILPWMIVAARGEAATGLWAACMTLVGMAGMFVQGVTNYLTPRAAHAYARGGLPELRRVLIVAGVAVLGVLGLFCAAVAFTGDWLVVLVYGAEFADSGTVFLLLAASLLMSSLGAVIGNGLWAIDRPALGVAADAATIITTVGLGLPLVFTWGITGAAAASLAGAAVGLIVRGLTLAGTISSQPVRHGQA
jgi:O-antigen/teichoic acid export membrane protein